MAQFEVAAVAACRTHCAGPGGFTKTRCTALAAELGEQPCGLVVGACDGLGSKVVKRVNLSAQIEGAVKVGMHCPLKFDAAVEFDSVVSKAAAYSGQGMRML